MVRIIIIIAIIVIIIFNTVLYTNYNSNLRADPERHWITI